MRILTTGFTELDRNKFKSIEESKIDLNKVNGCLYGSTEVKLPNGCVTSSWNRWTQKEECKNYRYGISYTLRKSAHVYEVSCYEDYDKLMKKYKMPSKYGIKGKYCIDFLKLSKDYDAFHLTENAFWDMRLPYLDSNFDRSYEDFYSYDAETWIILNFDAIHPGSILSRNNVDTTVDEYY